MLHGLIEPAFPKEDLDVAVVGISNWALDAAKMNRAIHLSRPDPGLILSISLIYSWLTPFSFLLSFTVLNNVFIDALELFKTGKAIQRAFGTEEISENTLRSIADAYFKYYGYQKTSKHKNFHGMQPLPSLSLSLTR